MAYYRRTQPLDTERKDAEEEEWQKDGRDPADARMKEPCLCRYEWMDEIDDPVLYGLLNGLLPCELELIDLSVFKKIPKAEIARMKGLDRTTVSRRISRLLSRLGKEMEPHFGQVRLSP
jgi:DNA-directed RNA polymerase specialized sigma24 family protein